MKLYRIYLEEISESYMDINADDERHARRIAQELLDEGLEQPGFEMGMPPTRTITEIVEGDRSTYSSALALQTEGLNELAELKAENDS